MTIDPAYITPEEAVEYVGQSEEVSDEFIIDTVLAASRFIDEFCARHFYTDGTEDDPAVRTFVPTCSNELRFGPFNDLVSAATIKSDTTGDGTYAGTVTNFTLEPFNPRGRPYTSLSLHGAGSFPIPIDGRRNVVQVAGIFGWPTLPPEVKAACRILVSEMVKLQEAPLGVAGVGFDGSAVYVGRRLPARVADLLSPLRHPDSFGVA